MRRKILRICLLVAVAILAAGCDHIKGPIGPDISVTLSRNIHASGIATCPDGTVATANVDVVIEATGHGSTQAEAEADANKQLDSKALLVYTSTNATASVKCGSGTSGPTPAPAPAPTPTPTPTPAPSCSYTLAAAVTVPAAGANTGVSVVAPAGCTWSIALNSAVPWVTIPPNYPSSFSGNGSALISIAPNTTGAARSGTITIAGKTFTINQSK